MSLVERPTPKGQQRDLFWKEILDRGFFLSTSPELVGRLPDKKRIGKLSAQDVKDLGTLGGNLRDPSIKRPRYVQGFIDRSLEFEAARGQDLEAYTITWRISGHDFAESPQPRVTLPHIDGKMQSSTVRGMPQPIPDRPPGDSVYYIATTLQGTIFYPGLYELTSPDFVENMNSTELIQLQNLYIEDEIQALARRKKPVQVPPLTIARFTGLDVHSRPHGDEHADRIVLSLILTPKNR